MQTRPWSAKNSQLFKNGFAIFAVSFPQEPQQNEIGVMINSEIDCNTPNWGMNTEWIYIPMRSRLLKPPPAQKPTSAIMARIRNSQFQKPMTGKMITYINNVQGAKMMPRIGHIKLPPNATFQYAGQNSHQIIAATRGPNRSRTVKKQHIANLLQEFIIPWVRKIHGESIRCHAK